jgi:hypothetical protein
MLARCVGWIAVVCVLVVVLSLVDTFMLTRSASTHLIKPSVHLQQLESSIGTNSSVTLTVIVSCMDIEIVNLVPHIFKQCLGSELSLSDPNVRTVMLIDPVCLNQQKKDIMLEQIDILKDMGVQRSFIQHIDVVDRSKSYQKAMYRKYLGVGYGDRIQILSTNQRLRPFLSYLYAIETCTTEHCVLLNSDVMFHNIGGRSWVLESLKKLNDPAFDKFIGASPYTGIDPINASYSYPGVIMKGSYKYDILDSSTIQMNNFVSTRALLLRKSSLMKILPFSQWSKERGFEWHLVTEMRKRRLKLFMSGPYTSWMLHITTGETKDYLLQHKDMLPFFLSSFESESGCFPPSQLCHHNIDSQQFWDWVLYCNSTSSIPYSKEFLVRTLQDCKNL